MPKINDTGHAHVRLLERWKGKPPQARFIKRGFRKVWMEHQPGQPGFEAEHHLLMAGVANETLAVPKRTPLTGHIDERYGSVGQLARDYFEAKANVLKPKDMRDRRRYIEQWLQLKLPDELDGQPVGLWAVEALNRRRMLRLRNFVPDPVRTTARWLNGKSTKAHYIDNHVWAVRVMFNWAIDAGWQSDHKDETTAVTFNPAARIEQLRGASDGWHTMTPDEVEQYLAHHKIGTMPYLAMMLLLYTVVRRSDVVRLGEPMLQRDGRLHFTERKGREKTPKARAIKLRKVVQDAIDAMPGARERSTYLATVAGEQFEFDYFSQRFKKWCAEAGLPHCSPHAVRKGVATEAGNKGKSDLVIAELLGHTTTKNVPKYTKKVNRAPLFDQGIDAVHEDGSEAAALLAAVAALKMPAALKKALVARLS